MTVKAAVSSRQPVRPGGGEGAGEPRAVGGGGENAEYVADKELVLELNKGARTYVINAINTVI